jgi:hypothetical protein
MEEKVEKALDNFVDLPEEEQVEKAKVDNAKKVVLDEREGLIERVDKVFVTKDGKQLLREWY